MELVREKERVRMDWRDETERESGREKHFEMSTVRTDMATLLDR